RYPKSLSQDVSINSNLKVFSWLSPAISFGSNIQENHRVESATITVIGVSSTSFAAGRGDLKSINRQANLSLSQNLDFAQVFPRVKLLRSLSNSLNYRTTDGDSYENVMRDFTATDKLWVRTPLLPTNLGARRTNLTLRDAQSINTRWSPLLGYFPNSPWGTLSITNNYSKSL
ncbi:MAG: hypothetical protein AABZ44_10605, partial [Elusimicrobiota bacterium]